jgi:hypothetical protein
MDPRQQTKALLWTELSTLKWPDVEGMYARIDEHAAAAAEDDAEPAEETESDAQ